MRRQNIINSDLFGLTTEIIKHFQACITIDISYDC